MVSLRPIFASFNFFLSLIKGIFQLSAILSRPGFLGSLESLLLGQIRLFLNCFLNQVTSNAIT